MFPHDHTFRYKSASAKLRHVAPDVYSLTNVESQVQGEGHATGVLKQVVSFADQHQLTIVLVVMQYGKEPNIMNNKQLEELYAKFGFKQVSRRPTGMIREPSQDLHAP